MKGYGWIPDKPDQRDHMFASPITNPVDLPLRVDLRPQCPPIYDQGQLGSCTANGIAGAIDFTRMKEGKAAITPSRLFIYYNERVMEGTVNSDAGAVIRDGIKSVAQLGAPPETDWPYQIADFTQKPPAQAYSDAQADLVTSYLRVSQTLIQIKGCIAAGYPVVFGFTVYESFESANVASTGVVPMPSINEGVLGGHCVMAVGYDDRAARMICRNSWGTGWGMDGYFTMPYPYFVAQRRLASDFWTIRAD